MSSNGRGYSQLAAYSDLFERLLDCGFLLDPTSYVILEVNAACERVLGMTPDKLVGRTLSQWVDMSVREDFGRALRVAMRRYYPRLFETLWRLPDQRVLTMEIQACPLTLSDRSQVLQVVARDITFRRETEQKLQILLQQLQSSNSKLELLSTVDEMTGLYNFRHLRTLLSQEHTRAARYRSTYSLIFCDIDYFKNYNDRNGHPAGDRLLREFAHILRQCARNTDFPIRYGGEEFVVLCPGVSWEGACILAERIRAMVESTAFEYGANQPSGRLTVSIGVGSYPNDGTSADEVLHSADEAVYFSKEHGRNRVTAAAKIRSQSPATVVPIRKTASKRPKKASKKRAA